MKYRKYDTSIKLAESKLKKLEKAFSQEDKKLNQLQRAWTSGKERVHIAKLKATSSSTPSILKRVSLTIQKQETLTKEYRGQKTKVSEMKKSLRFLSKEIKDLKTEKRQYERAMEKYEKQWLKFYASSSTSSDKKLNAPDKVDFGIQLRAARALLNLSIKEFSTLCDLPKGLLEQIEQPSSIVSLEPNIIKNIKGCLRKAGVELIDEGFHVGVGGIGVRMRKKPSSIRTSKPKNILRKSQSSISKSSNRKRKNKKVA